jgi:hypothetical protein
MQTVVASETSMSSAGLDHIPKDRNFEFCHSHLKFCWQRGIQRDIPFQFVVGSNSRYVRNFIWFCSDMRFVIVFDEPSWRCRIAGVGRTLLKNQLNLVKTVRSVQETTHCDLCQVR